MKPTILLYHLPEGERLLKIKKALFPLGMKLRAVKKEEYLEPVGYLAGVKELVKGRSRTDRLQGSAHTDEPELECAEIV